MEAPGGGLGGLQLVEDGNLAQHRPGEGENQENNEDANNRGEGRNELAHIFCGLWIAASGGPRIYSPARAAFRVHQAAKSLPQDGRECIETLRDTREGRFFRASDCPVMSCLIFRPYSLSLAPS